MLMPIYTLSGLPRHGKTTLASFLATTTGLPYADCSSIIYHELASRRGVTVESLKGMDKQALRTSLIELGDALCADDPAALAIALAEKGVRIISGVRRPAELQGLNDWGARRGVEVIPIWVEALDDVKGKQFRALHREEVEVYSAPTILDNTDPSLRGMCRHVVPNISTSHLWAIAKFIHILHSPAQSDVPTPPHD